MVSSTAFLLKCRDDDDKSRASNRVKGGKGVRRQMLQSNKDKIFNFSDISERWK